MRITYDSEVDALFIRFLEGPVTTEHVAEGVALDQVAFIEILLRSAIQQRCSVRARLQSCRSASHRNQFPYGFSR